MEPLLFTSSLIPNWLHKQSFAWRPLAYLVNFTSVLTSVQKRKNPQGTNICNYHCMLKAAFAGVKACQRKGGMPFTFTCQTGLESIEATNVMLKVPIAFVIGDCPAQDKLCGKYDTHTKGVKLVCRECDCLMVDADDEWLECNPMTPS